MELTLSSEAESDLARLQKATASRITHKIKWFAVQPDPLHFAIPLKGRAGFFRFRIGDYRVLFTLKKGIIVILLVLSVKHRSEAYR